MTTFFIILSSLLALISPLVYARSIIKRNSKPHRTTRIILLFFTILATASLIAKHDHVAIWLAAVSTLQAVFIFVLSLKYGVGGWAKIDLICLALAVCGIYLWKTTQEPVFALFFAIMADLTGMIPTLIKTYHFPGTEIWQFWLMDTFAGLFNLLAVHSWTPAQFAYPLYITLINFSVFLLVVRSKLWSE